MLSALLARSACSGFRSTRIALTFAVLALLPVSMFAKVVVFWQPGFPTVGSEPIDRQALTRALDGMDASFADLNALKTAGALDQADLLVLPYGSAVPVDAWSAVERYLHGGGSLLILGGQPLQVPVVQSGERFEPLRAQNSYAGEISFRNTYEVPVAAGAQFKWRDGYALGAAPRVRARTFFAAEGHLDGLGYMADKEGLLVAAPVIAADHTEGPMAGSRIVAIDFDPEPGYWQSDDGIALICTAARYAAQGAVSLHVETLFSTLRPGELPMITAHLRVPRGERSTRPTGGELKVTLSSEQGTVDSATVPVAQPGLADVAIPFHKPLPAGFYNLTAIYSGGGQFRAYYQDGFWVEDASAISSGPRVTANGDFLARDGAPFFPVGTNYFSTESDGWDFSGPRNAAVWEHDFAEMEQHGVTFVRTGVWMHFGRFTQETAGGGASERFLRNVEAFLLCAQRHHIVVNFTLFAMSPRAGDRGWGEQEGTLPNPYLDSGALSEQQAYARSVVERFKDAPFVTWDLINEPSFSNPRVIFKGNVPNGDPAEVTAWHKWLREKYNGDLQSLAGAWSVPAGTLGGFDGIPLPAAGDLIADRYGNPREIRALDYNLFAQDMFGNWVQGMVALIRATGSTQLINVGQDEGGVTDRVLNQFYGGAGVSFTTNHTYWQDDALLWDSIAAKRPGLANITGETGFQPVWYPDGTWRYNEFTGLGLTLRKWALGFAAGSSGAVQWDWDREADFGMKRSDGSSKTWENQMRALGEFAKKAAPAATALIQPDVAIVLPQSLQLSVENHIALEAQQNAVRALYGYARAQAYAVGEYQIDLLGHPKLILLPAPMGLTDAAWQAILDRVNAGTTLLVTGPFDGDPHLHATGRAQALGIGYSEAPLTIREQLVKFPWGDERLTFSGMKTTTLTQAQLADGSGWMETKIGKGRILFSPLPLELSDNLAVIGNAYRYALKAAEAAPVYTTSLADPGILIAPTMFPKATMYVITSESNQAGVSFTDARSGKTLAGDVEPGSAAILVVGIDGKVQASWNWTALDR
jgi:Beta-galactosidase